MEKKERKGSFIKKKLFAECLADKTLGKGGVCRVHCGRHSAKEGGFAECQIGALGKQST